MGSANHHYLRVGVVHHSLLLLLLLLLASSSFSSSNPTVRDPLIPSTLFRNNVDRSSIRLPLGDACLVDQGGGAVTCSGLNSSSSRHSLNNIPPSLGVRWAELVNCTLPLPQIFTIFPNLEHLSLTHSPTSFISPSIPSPTTTTQQRNNNNVTPPKQEEEEEDWILGMTKSSWGMSVKVLNISWNGLEAVPLGRILPFFPNLEVLDISHNWVDQVEFNLRGGHENSHPHLKWVDISGNPLDCTARMEWLDDGQVTLLHADQTVCHSPPHQNKAKPIWKVRKLIKKVRDECRGNCSCDITYIWEQNHVIHSKTTVNCSGRGFLDFPDPATLPNPTDTLDLSNNHIVSMRRFVEDDRFEGLDVMNLHLDSNKLESIALLETSDWFNFQFQIFTFRNNSVKEVPVYVLENVFSHNTRILQIDLSLNPFHCDCTTLSTLKNWLLKHAANIGHIEDVRCLNTGAQVRYLRHEDWCRVEAVDAAGLIDLLDLISIFLALAILGVVSKVYYDYWNLKHNGKLPWVATKM